MKCWRCGRKLKRDNVQIWHLVCGLAVPVCADDRQCYEKGLYLKKGKMKVNEGKNNVE